MSVWHGDRPSYACDSDPVYKLIREQAEQMKAAKEMYDMDYPLHHKLITADELWRMARARALEIVCNPSAADDTGDSTY